MTSYRRTDILGCPFDVISFSETVEQIESAVLENGILQVCTANVDFVMKARRDPEFAEVLGRADCVVADGVPIVWAASLLGRPLRGRVNGTDLVWKCAEFSARTGSAVALVGSAFQVAQLAASRMMERFPGARMHPIRTAFPLGASENAEVVKSIRSLDTKIVLVALGAPRQDSWIQQHLEACGANVGIGIGSALDMISGDKRRAPGWMRDHGLEWFYRMLLEPRRLGRRYLIDDSPFLLLLALGVASRVTGIGRAGLAAAGRPRMTAAAASGRDSRRS